MFVIMAVELNSSDQRDISSINKYLVVVPKELSDGSEPRKRLCQAPAGMPET